MLLSTAKNKEGRLLACDVTNAEELCKEFDLDVAPATIASLRLTLSSETDVVSEIVEHAYEAHPTHVEYDEVATCIRVRVFTVPPVPKVLIGLDGGLIQWINSDTPVKAICLDHDIEGLDDEDTTTWTDINGHEGKCHVIDEQPNVNERFVARVFREVRPQLD